MSNSTTYSLNNHEVHNQGQDWISKLPDHVIVSILLHIELKDAVKTCILSKRWRYMWTNLADFKFDENILWQNSPSHFLHLKFGQEKFVSCVNQVVNSLREDISINKFEISFNFNRDYAPHIDRWVKFAFSKRVKTLKLRICDFCPIYTLGSDNLVKDLSSERGMKFLTTLHLSSLTLKGEVVEFMLARCSLERLSISRIFGLERLRVKDSSSKLKYLKIDSCDDLKELELDARELVCFEYRGKSANIAYNYVPSIVQVDFSTYDLHGWPLHFWHFESFSNQLIKLSLMLRRLPRMDLDGLSPDHQEFPRNLCSGSFPSLKYLDLSLSDTWDDLVAWMRLAPVCPLLLEFKLKVLCEDFKFTWKFDADEQEIEGEYFETKLVHWATQVRLHPLNTLPNLRSFEHDGFVGTKTDVQLVMHIVEAAPMLSRICLNSTPTYDRCCKHRREASKERACILSASFPSSIDVKVL